MLYELCCVELIGTATALDERSYAMPGDTNDSEPDLNIKRSFTTRPMNERCPKGHLDWKVVQRGDRLIMRCHQCGAERPFDLKLIKP